MHPYALDASLIDAITFGIILVLVSSILGCCNNKKANKIINMKDSLKEEIETYKIKHLTEAKKIEYFRAIEDAKNAEWDNIEDKFNYLELIDDKYRVNKFIASIEVYQQHGIPVSDYEMEIYRKIKYAVGLKRKKR